MKFKCRRLVHVGFRSGEGINIWCDQILFKEGYFDRLIFKYKEMAICDCIFNIVASIEYFEDMFCTEATPIDKYDIVSGDLVDCI